MVLTVIMAIVNIDKEITAEGLVEAKRTCLLPIIVHSDPQAAQITYDLSLVMTLCICLCFLPCLLYLVVIQCQNFMLGQTTNTRFSKFKRNSVSEDQLRALADEDSSEDAETQFTARTAPLSMRSRDSEHRQDTNCLANCTAMMCSAGDFNKQ